MASMSFTQFSLMPRIYRWHLNGNTFPCMNLVQIQDFRLNRKVIMAVSKDETTELLSHEVSDGEAGSVEKKTRKTSKRAFARSRKKVADSSDENSSVSGSVKDEEMLTTSISTEDSRKPRTRTRKKVQITNETLEEEKETKNVTRQRTRKKKADHVESQGSDREEDALAMTENLEEKPTKTITRQRRRKKKVDDVESDTELSDHEEDSYAYTSTLDEDSEQELKFDIDDGEDISFTYGWPPLVCCFGAAQHAFVPAGRRANRLLDYEIHERKKDALWAPEKFVRASGGCASNVAIALASLGGKVAFMGKLGDDDWGQSLLYYLNMNKVQTRSLHVDSNKTTAISHMKIGRRGGLRMSSVKPRAEDCLSPSEINIDVLKEAKMFYFNTSSLLDRNMRSTTLRAVKTAKKLGNVVFYDVNLPLPLWQSSEEAKMFIQTFLNLSDIVEVTKQELEFLCGITSSERFDTKDNDRSKFTHYPPEVVAPLWHENLKVLFVTNGTSKIHYYTKEHNGSVLGMEDAPITPYTSDMSASGDGIIAGLMRMLTVQPHLISDKGYLERTVKYAISCGVIDQWLQARALGYPVKEGMEDVVSDPHGIRSITEKEYRTLVPSTS